MINPEAIEASTSIAIFDEMDSQVLDGLVTLREKTLSDHMRESGS